VSAGGAGRQVWHGGVVRNLPARLLGGDRGGQDGQEHPAQGHASQALRAGGAYEMDAPGRPGHHRVGHPVDHQRPPAGEVQPEDGGHGSADRETKGEQEVERLGAAAETIWLSSRGCVVLWGRFMWGAQGSVVHILAAFM
jgi:hypothetical protein